MKHIKNFRVFESITSDDTMSLLTKLFPALASDATYEILEPGGNKKVPVFFTPDWDEQGEVEDTLSISIKNKSGDDFTLNVDFKWYYEKKDGMKGNGYMTPDDADTVVLREIDIRNVYVYDNVSDNEKPLDHSKIDNELKQYIANHLPTD